MTGKAGILLLALSLSLVGPASAWAKPAGLCVECHSSLNRPSVNDPSLALDRSVYQARLDPCPGIRSLAEENFFTESRIVKLNDLLGKMEREGRPAEPLKATAAEAAESFSSLTPGQFLSADRFARESSSIRAALQKAYDRTLLWRENSSRRLLIGIGLLAFIGTLVLLGIGFRKLNRMGKAVLAMAALAGSLGVSSCSSGRVEPSAKSPAQEKLEGSLSAAAQLSRAVEDESHRSVLLAQIAGDWSKIDPEGAEQAFRLSSKMALNAGERAGEMEAFRDVVSQPSGGNEGGRKKGGAEPLLDLKDEMRSTEGRAWALRAVAEEWVRADAKKGRAALEAAADKAMKIRDGEIRDRDLKAISEAWGPIDPNQAREISLAIHDPFLKSIALLNIARKTSNRDTAGDLVREAWKSSQLLSPPYLRAAASARVSASGAGLFPQEKKFWADQAFLQIGKIKEPAFRGRALQNLIFEWAAVDPDQAERWADGLPAESAEAKAYSFLRISRVPGLNRERAVALVKKAWREADREPDSFESRRIRMMAGRRMAGLDFRELARFLPAIDDPFFRSQVLSETARELSSRDPRKALEAAEAIPLEPIRTRAAVEVVGKRAWRDREKVLSICKEALNAAESIPEPYERALRLVELGKIWPVERGMENPALESAWKTTGKIPVLSARTEVLDILSSAWRSSDPAKAQAIQAQTAPSVSMAQKSLAEVRLWAKADPGRARKRAVAIPSPFPYERAVAFKEIAAAWKKTQPQAALGDLEKALQEARNLPQGPGQKKLLSDIFGEAALLDKPWTLRKIGELPDRPLRDSLLAQAGAVWAREDPLQALRAARDISEGSSRLPVYGKAADTAAQKPGKPGEEASSPLLSALACWGQAREKAKTDERDASSLFEKAAQELEKISDPLERSCLMAGLAAEWASLDEKKASALTGRILQAQSAEPYSYALLRVGAQFGKWDRKEAASVFQKTLLSAESMPDRSLKSLRLLQLAREWRAVDRGKGKEVLLLGEKEARSAAAAEASPQALFQVLRTRVEWNPEECLEICRGESPAVRAPALLEGARLLRGKTLDEDVKILEKALQSAERDKNSRLMAEIGSAWYELDPQRGLEILGRVEKRELRVKALRQIGRSGNRRSAEEARHLLHLAADEAQAVPGLTDRLELLKEIGRDLSPIDKDRARAVYLRAYQIAEQEYLSFPKTH